MPVYEYYCADCKTKFDALRRMSQADDPIPCPHCGGTNTSRLISTFSAISKDSSGSRSIGGSNACSTCTATTCSLCRIK